VGSALWTLPRAYNKQEVGYLRLTAAQHCAKAKRCIYEGQKPDKLLKGWIFRDSTWNLDALTGGAGEVVKA